MQSDITVSRLQSHITQSCIAYVCYVDVSRASNLAGMECIIVKSNSFGRSHALSFQIDVGTTVHAFMHW
jgi:hypothetical protein